MKGYPGREPVHHSKSKSAEFAPAPGVKVLYAAAPNQVKETIELAERGPAEFRYKLTSPGMKPRQLEEAIVFDSRHYLGLFRIDGLKVWDAEGSDIPASLTLEGTDAVVRLDPQALAEARTPITIDPVVSGAIGSSPNSRRLFETSDGRFLLLHLVNSSDKWYLAYSVSTDEGSTWSEPTLIGPAPGILGGAAAQIGPDDTLYLTYGSEATSTFVGFRRLTPLADGTWSIGQETAVATGEITWLPRPNIADLGDGASGRRLAIGFVRYNPLGYLEYLVAFSENSGDSWSAGSKCADAASGTLTVQGSRLFCMTPASGQEHIEVREWNGLTWSLPVTIPVGGGLGCHPGDMPSTVVTDDGRLHLVVSASPTGSCFDMKTQYSYLSPGSSEWTTPFVLGASTRPVISTDGMSLYVFAEQTVASSEHRIDTYISTNTVDWSAGAFLSGRAFSHVIDENASWGFQDDFGWGGDPLFSISDAEGEWGNRIGTSSSLHKLDSLEKKISQSFVATDGGLATSITIWSTAQSSPTYRIGIQSDCSAVDPFCIGAPSGNWLEALTFSGTYADATPADTSAPEPLEVTLGEDATLSPGVRYHVVVEPVSDPLGIDNPSAQRWMAVQTVGADAGAEGSLRVLERSGSGWSAVAGNVPRVEISNPAAILASQNLAPFAPYEITEYSVPGESFVASRDFQPTSLKVLLGKTGEPTSSLTLRLLDDQGTELWSQEATPAGEGWLSLAVSGVSLAAGGRYWLVADSHAEGDYWTLLSSIGPSSSPLGPWSSWDGEVSGFTRAFDRIGLNDRTSQASDYEFSAFNDFWAFNGSATDALYLGDEVPFEFARVDGYVEGGIEVTFSYWNGSSWAALPTTHNTFAQTNGWGTAEWQMPQNWATSTVGDKTAYWVKVESTASSATPLRISRTTGIRNFMSPTAGPGGGTYVPFAWEDRDISAIVTNAWGPGDVLMGTENPTGDRYYFSCGLGIKLEGTTDTAEDGSTIYGWDYGGRISCSHPAPHLGVSIGDQSAGCFAATASQNGAGLCFRVELDRSYTCPAECDSATRTAAYTIVLPYWVTHVQSFGGTPQALCSPASSTKFTVECYIFDYSVTRTVT